MKNIFTLGFMMLICLANGQNLTGKWIAYAEDNNGLYAELYITDKNGQLYGYSYDEESDNSFCEYLLEGYFDGKRMNAENTERIDGSQNHSGVSYKLKYRTEGRFELLQGKIKPQDAPGLRPNIGIFMGTGGVAAGVDIASLFLSSAFPILYIKESDELTDMPDHIKRYFDLPEPVAEAEDIPEPEPDVAETDAPYGNAEAPDVPDTIATMPDVVEVIEEEIEKEEIEETPIDSTAIKQQEIEERISKREARTTKVIDKFTTAEEKVTLHIYDSKQEDNDQVTIFLNDVIIVENLVVKNQYQAFEVPLQKGMNKLTFYADNLGDVPPNTANLRIILGKKREHYLMSTDENENSAIEIFVE